MALERYFRSISLNTKYPVTALIFLILLGITMILSFFYIFRNSMNIHAPLSVAAVWFLAGILSESLTVYSSKGNIYIAVTDAVFYAAYLCEGVQTAAAVIVVSFIFSIHKGGGKIRFIFNTPFRLTLFNLCHYILILMLIDMVFMFFSKITGGLFLIPAIVTAPFFFLFSCILNALFYKLEEKRNFRKYFADIFLPVLPDALLGSLGAVIVAMAYPVFGSLSVLLAVLPLAVARMAFVKAAEN